MWVLPSRSRPQNIARFLASGAAPVPLWLRIDDDDPELARYLHLDGMPAGTTKVGPRVGLSALYNEAFLAFPDRPWYGVLADDIVPETPGWDSALIEAAGTDGLAFGDDGINGPAHATHFVLGGDLVREFGWLALPGLSRIYIDTVWADIARERGVFRYLPNVKLTHLHFSNGRAFWDATYRKPGKAFDRAVYQAWKTSKETP